MDGFGHVERDMECQSQGADQGGDIKEVHKEENSQGRTVLHFVNRSPYNSAYSLIVVLLVLGSLDYYLNYPFQADLITKADLCHLILLCLLFLRTLRSILRILFLSIIGMLRFLFSRSQPKKTIGRVTPRL
jgi:hypothetical protein